MLLILDLNRLLRIVLLCILSQNFVFAQQGDPTGSLPTKPPSDCEEVLADCEEVLADCEEVLADCEEVLVGFEHEFPAMGTMVRLTAYGKNTTEIESAFRKAEQLTEELSAILSDYHPESETRRLSDSAVSQPVQVSKPLWEVLQAADSWYYQSTGALDCSLGALTSLWRKHRRVHRTPSADAITLAREATGWPKVQLDHQQRSVQLSDSRLRLDFGAIGKGYIVDQLFELLEEMGIQHCLINISGNMRIGEPPPGKSGWKIAVAPLEPEAAAICQIELSRSAVATSGDLWQFSIVDGQKQSHILNPNTGFGVPGPLSVTVIAPTAMDADALATIGCIQPWDHFERLIQSIEGTAAIRVAKATDELQILSTPGFPQDLANLE